MAEFNIENYKVILQDFSLKDGILYWSDKPLAKRGTDDTVQSGTPYTVNGEKVSIFDGGTGKSLVGKTGLLKVTTVENGAGNVVSCDIDTAVDGVDFLSANSENTLTKKSINALDNTITQISYKDLAAGMLNDDILKLNKNASGQIENLDLNSLSIDPTIRKDIEEHGSLVTDKAVKEYIDYSMARQSYGQVIKEPVVAATTENIDLSESLLGLGSIDGVVLKSGDRILVKDQSNQFQNGIYTVTAGAPVRAQDAKSGTRLVKATVSVLSGIKNKGSTWYCDCSYISEWTTPIKWVMINQYPIYNAGRGINVNLSDGTISINDQIVISRDSENVLETKYGGTGNGTFNANSVIVAKNRVKRKKEDGSVEEGDEWVDESEIYFDSISVPKTSEDDDVSGRIVITDNKGTPGFSAIKYPNVNDVKINSFLFVDEHKNVVSLKPGIDGILYVNDTGTLDSLDAIPKDILENSGAYIKNKHQVSVADGGTGKSGISAGYFLYGSGNNEYTETSITEFGRRVVSTDSEYGLRTALGLTDVASMTVGTTAGTVAAGDHTHDEYARLDGSTRFTKPVSGEEPEKGSDFATRSYVDRITSGVINGQIRQAPVIRVITELPFILNAGDRFLVSSDVAESTPVIGGRADCIVTVKDPIAAASPETISDGFDFTIPAAGFTVECTSTHESFMYCVVNSAGNCKWLPVATKDPHNSMADLQGGGVDEFYHLDKNQYIDLTTGAKTSLHKHSHDELTGLLGGYEGQRYHLSASQYNRLNEDTFMYHDALYNLSGGDFTKKQYYHLSEKEHDELTSRNKVTSIHVHSHADLADINAPSLDKDDVWHISKNEYDLLTQHKSADSIHHHDHDKLENLRGGGEGKYFHLSELQYENVKNLDSKIKTYHNDLEGILGSETDDKGVTTQGYYHLTQKQFECLTQKQDANEYHVHSGYLSLDGLNGEQQRLKVSPICTFKDDDEQPDTNIATIGYIKTKLSTGISWLKSVTSKGVDRPTNSELEVGLRYIVSGQPRYADWALYPNGIAEWNGSGWVMTRIQYDKSDEANYNSTIGFAVLVKDSMTTWVWNGENWVEFAVRQEHNALGSLEGGSGGRYFHLSDMEYLDLVSCTDCKIHYHADAFETASGVLGINKGGTGLMSIPKNKILYSIDDDKLTVKPLTEFVIDAIFNKEKAEDIRLAIGLNDMSTQSRDNVTITGGRISGLAEPLPITSGGTGLRNLTPNSMFYVDSTGESKEIKVKDNGLAMLNMSREEAISHLGIDAPGSITKETPNGRSKLFYMIAMA